MKQLEFTDSITPEAYLTLREKAGWRRITDRQAEMGLRNATFVAAVRQGDEYVGMGRVLYDYGYVAYLCDILVDPDCQGLGIGKKIVLSLMERVKQAAQPGEKLTFVLVAAKDKEPFYEKLGFRLRPSEIHGAGMSMDVEVE